jgi:hypothetical protein
MKSNAIASIRAFTIALIALFITIGFGGSNALAQDLKFDEYRKFLMSGSETKGTKKMAIQTTCTNSRGEVTRIGETAYDLCLNEVRNHNERKNLPDQKNLNAPNAPSVGTSTTIHIGN